MFFEYEGKKLFQEASKVDNKLVKVDVVKEDNKYEGSIVQPSVRKKVGPVNPNFDVRNLRSHLVLVLK